MTGKTSCSSCGAKIASGDRFCGVCGADLGGSAPSASGGKAGASFNKTMLGVSLPQTLGAGGPQPSAPAATDTPRPAPKSFPQRTMLGMASPFAGDMAREAAKTAGASAAPLQPTAAPSAAAGPAASSGAAVPKHTLLGVSPILAPNGAVPAAQPPPAAPAKNMAGPAPTPEPASDKRDRPSAQTDRTMLGIAAPALPSTPGNLETADTLEAAMSGGPASPRAQSRPRSFTPVSTTPVSTSDDGSAGLGPVQAPALRWLWLAVGALAVLAIGGGVLAWLSLREADLRVRVVSEAGSELLEVEAPGSPADAKLRFAGLEQPLKAGRARFPLKADALTIGDNALAIDLLEKDGSVASSHITLKVAYRVRLDTAKLAAANPALEVVVDAIPGSKVTLDGAPLGLNEHGRGIRAYPVAALSGGVFAFQASYRVEPPGEPAEEDKLEVALPLASMQIDRPGPEVVTDQPVIEVAGAVEPGAAVTVDARPVDVIDGRFLYRAPLENAGEHVLKVVARAKGKVPRVSEIKVQRVADMTLAAASFTADPTLTYARIAQNPVMYRGQKVAFDGRVYNVEVVGGKSVLQMLVLQCPGQNRCPLWVEYPQATEATIDSWVRVLGVVAGEQQFRSKQNQVQTVPSVHAQYVLKLARK